MKGSTNLPGLPSLPLSARLMRGPTASSNWVIPDCVLAGEYPAHNDNDVHLATLTSYISQGITTFVCLQEDKELRRFRGYIDDYRRLSSGMAGGMAVNTTLLRFPIQDGYEAEDEAALLEFVLDLVERVREGEKLYIHCWAGRGRTGIIVACMLGVLYSIPALEALQRTNLYYTHREVYFGDSPEYYPQKMQVVRVLQRHAELKQKEDGVPAGNAVAPITNSGDLHLAFGSSHS